MIESHAELLRELARGIVRDCGAPEGWEDNFSSVLIGIAERFYQAGYDKAQREHPPIMGSANDLVLEEPPYVTGFMVPDIDRTTGERLYRQATDDEKLRSKKYWHELEAHEAQAMAQAIVLGRVSPQAWDAAQKIYIDLGEPNG